jgi:tetratricopeptide (TPR) repeat protein
VAAVVCLAALAAGVLALRGAEVLDPEHGNNPLKLRVGNVRVAGEIVSDHPWLGVGPGGYGEAYALYRLEGDNETRHAHNLPMEMVAEFGVPGGLLLGVLFLVLFLEPLIKAVRSGVAMKEWRFGAALGLAVFAVHNLADYTAYMPSLLWLMAILRGLVSLPRDDSAEAEEPDSRAPFRWADLTALGTLLVVVTAATISAGQGLAWNARYAAMEAHAAGQRQEALAAANRAVRLAPWDVDACQLQARLNLETGNVALAARVVEKTIALSPLKASSWSLRGVIRSMQGDGPGALADLEQAARLHPARNSLQEEAAVYREQVEAALSREGRSGD